MAKPTPQQCHALITYFMTKYEEVVGSKSNLNRNKARWGFESILMDRTPAEARALVDYFFKHYEPDVDWFIWNYEKVVESQEQYEVNQEALKHRRNETQQRLDEWKKRWGK